ncbi:MAG: hypothetical protein CSB48_13880 [Proteobacteria bacterium]|nr:MAG: hypothetical protein CSB48_13880 [Pseudomonadota bacterium]
MLVTFIFVGITGCYDSKTEKAFNYADDLQLAIERFEQSRTDTSREVNEITEEVIKKLAEETPDLRWVAKSWESEWRDVQGKYDKLVGDFSMVATSSRSYFNQLEQLANEIKNSTIKAPEQEKNARLKTSWTETFNQASKDIEKLSTLIKDGNDFHKVLIGASLREKLVQNIDDLKNISKRAQILLHDLEKLTIEGKKLTAN